MIQVRGVTYRVERTEPQCYSVVRILDDVHLGTFRTRSGLRLHPLDCDFDLFAEIAKTALRFARTSGMMRAVAAPSLASAPAVTHLPSTMPPRSALI